MKHVLSNVWADDSGALLATEWVVLATILVIGIVPGLIAVRQGTLEEMLDFSNATMSLDQSYEFDGQEVVGTDGIRLVHGNQGGLSGQSRHGDMHSRKLGEGSITEITPKGIERRSTPGALTGHEVSGSLTGPQSGGSLHSEQRGPIARTAGSAFVQGNHTEDGSELHSGTNHLKNHRVAPSEGSAMPADPCD
jgi:hypothetical protein